MEAPLLMEFEPNHFFSSFFHTSKAILISPRDFFPRMKKKGDYLKPFVYMLCCVAFHVVIFGVLHKNPNVMVKTLLLGMVFPLITAGILFVIVTRIFKATGSYETVFRINAYASAANLVTWLPLIGILLELYRIYLIVVGLSEAFSIKLSQAFLSVVLTMAVYIAAAAALTPVMGGQ